MSRNKNLLMIFIRNARIGQVKTRLAATVGDERALEIYILLLDYTSSLTAHLPVDKAVFYSDFMEEVDEFPIPIFQKYLQLGNDLGDKMKNAFIKMFARGYEKVIIIGSDCYELSPEIIESAFQVLDENEVVIGPAKDGGYYLLGSKKLIPEFFSNKTWSTNNVLLDTILDCKNVGLSYFLLPELNDIDEEIDLPAKWRK